MSASPAHMRQIVSPASHVLLGALLAAFVAGCSCGASHERLDDGGPGSDADRCVAPSVDLHPDFGPCTPAMEGLVRCGHTPGTGATCSAGCWWELDDGSCRPSGDAGVTPTTFYTLEPAEADTWVQHDRCEAIANSAVALEVTVHLYSSCDSPGPVEARVDEASREIQVRARVWREQGEVECMPTGAAFVRDVVVSGLTPGMYTVRSDAGDFELEVGPPPFAACTAETPLGIGGLCNGDCDCETGLSCVAQRGDAVCSHTCQPLCERSGVGGDSGRSCRLGSVCVNDPNFGSLCRTPSMDLCGPMSMCPAGMTCVSDSDAASQCEWEIELNGATRHVCSTNADCDAGLDCVAHPSGERRCEVRCVTADMRCPGRAPHMCNELGICEWLGE